VDHSLENAVLEQAVSKVEDKLLQPCTQAEKAAAYILFQSKNFINYLFLLHILSTVL
jgi:hypothetical protein